MQDGTIEEQAAIVQGKLTASNAVVLGNMIELTTSIVHKVAGNDIADTIAGNTVNREVITNLVANKIKEKLATVV